MKRFVSMKIQGRLAVLMALLVACVLPQFVQAIERDESGVYLIGSDADYEEFCKLVNTGDPFASARVTADGINVTRSIGAGDREYHFRGKFDGQGHTMTLNGVPLFEHTQHGSVISNVNLTGNLSATGEYAGSLIAHAVSPTIENCNSSVVINASGASKAGGLVGYSRGTATILNSSFSGQVTGAEECAGLIGWNQHTAIIKSCQATGVQSLAGNLKEGANIVENTMLGDLEVAMAVEAAPAQATDSIIASMKAKVAPMAGTISASIDGIDYSLGSGSGTATVVNVSTSLTSVKVPPTVTYNGVEYTVNNVKSMNGGKNMESVEIPNTVNKIENDAFKECTKLQDVIFADGSTTLALGFNDYTFADEELFELCPIYYVYVGRNLSWDKGEDPPFQERDKLKMIDFGPRVTVVGNSNGGSSGRNELFDDCDHVEKYFFYGDEQSLGTEVTFYCCEGMSDATQAYISRDLKASKYTEYTVLGSGWGISDRLSAVAYGPFATYVTSKMYSGIAGTPNNNLTGVRFDEATRLTTIKERAFADCDKLEKVDFSNTALKTIEKEGFYDCDKLADVNFGSTVETIGQSAFDDCGLINIILPGSLKTLGYKAFYDCDELESLSLSPGEGEIKCEDDGGECRTFDSCSNLKSMYMGRTVTYNEGKEKASPFYDSYFENVLIDNKVSKLGQYMFQHSNKLKSLSIGTGITSIPNNCFNETLEITQFNLVDTIAPITLGASCKDFKVATLYVGRPINDINNIPAGEKALEVLQYGPCVGEVKSNSFTDFGSLKYVTLPSEITVASNAFVNCGIETIYVEGNATFQTSAVKNCNNIHEITVVGKLTLDENAFAPASNANAPRNLNVFFMEDPKDESHANAFPQKYLDETTLNNLYDTPYQKVDFTCLPWSGFKNRTSSSANDYAPTTEAMRNGDYDHAFFRNEHKAGNFFCITMPFAISTYYFGSNAEVYEYGAMGFKKEVDDEAMTLTTARKTNLDNQQNFFTNKPYLIRSQYDDNLIKGTFDQFITTQVNVNFTPAMYSDLGPTLYHVSGKDEVINPSMGNLYVLDNGCLKKVNGDYNLPAFSIAFKPDGEKKLHFIDSETGMPLMPESADVTSHPELMGYVTYYSNESDFIAEGAEVYTVSQDIMENGTPTLKFNLVKDNVINKGQGVLIKYYPGETLTMTMVTNPSSDTEAYESNVLKGVNYDTPVSELGNIFVLGKAENAVGFFPLSRENLLKEEDFLPAHRAYINPTDVDPEALPYVVDIDTPTVINGLNVDGKASRIYDLNGRRVFNPEKGNIYIKDGQKIIQK